MEPSPIGSRRPPKDRRLLYAAAAVVLVALPVAFFLVTRLSEEDKGAERGPDFALRHMDPSLQRAPISSRAAPKKTARIKVLNYSARARIGLDELKRLLGAQKDKRSSRLFIQAFSQDPELMALWDKASRTGDTGAFMDALAASPKFAELVQKFRDEPGFDDVAMELARHPALRDLVVDILAGRPDPGGRIARRDMRVMGIGAGSTGGGGAGRYGQSANAFTSGARSSRAQLPGRDSRMAAVEFGAPDVGEGTKAHSADCDSMGLDRQLTGQLRTLVNSGASYETACAQTGAPERCARMVSCCRQDPACLHRIGAASAPDIGGTGLTFGRKKDKTSSEPTAAASQPKPKTGGGGSGGDSGGDKPAAGEPKVKCRCTNNIGACGERGCAATQKPHITYCTPVDECGGKTWDCVTDASCSIQTTTPATEPATTPREDFLDRLPAHKRDLLEKRQLR